jgi:Na+-transporting NADH:ubiquinone oxidoreductase subunit NqrB
MMKLTPDFLRRLSIHRLMLYYLLTLLLAAELFCVLHVLPYPALDLAFSACVIAAAAWAGNWAFAKVWSVQSAGDSVWITALILILIITPFTPNDLHAIGYAVFASLWAMAAKYMFTAHRRNIFNPAAFGVALAALALGSSVSWWIGGNLYVLPLVILGGLLIMAKMTVAEMLAAFAASSLITVAMTSPAGHPLQSAGDIALHSMFFFFGFVMLTEPKTAPLGRTNRILYGALVGILFAPEIHLGPWYTTPEIALLIGNLFSAATYWQRRRAVAAAAA